MEPAHVTFLAPRIFRWLLDFFWGGGWNSVVVKALLYKSEGPGIFPEESDRSMCPGAESASKSEYQDIPGGKGGRCVKLHVPIVKKSGGDLTSWNPVVMFRPVMGQL